MYIECKRVWFISDLHFGIRNNSLEWLEIQKKYYEEFLIPLLKEHYQPGDVLFNLGDTFDSRNSINTLVLNTTLTIFTKLSKILPVYILIGNHDIYKKSENDVNSLKFFNYLPNITVFEEPQIINTSIGKKIFVVPWRPNEHIEPDLLDNNKSDYLFCHTLYNGAYFNKYTLIEDGEDSIKFKPYKHVYSGHIHYRQTQGNFDFIGCPYSLSRSDIDNQKGVYCLDLETNTHTFIPNNYSPKFLKVNIEQVLNMTLDEYTSYVENNFVDIYCDVKWTLIVPFTKLFELSTTHKKIDIRIQNTVENIDTLEEVSDIDNEFDIMKLMKKYIDSLTHPEKVKDLLEKKLTELYNRTVCDDEEIK